MGPLIAIIKKEILDGLRDGKSMSTALLLPIILAFITFGSTHFLVSYQTNSADVTLPVSGAERIVPLIDKLKEAGIKIVAAPDDPEQAIQNQEFYMVLIVPEDFSEQFREQKTASLYLLSDHSRTESQGSVMRIRQLIQNWSLTTAALRLITRNVSPEIVNPINVSEINVTSDQRLASRLLAGLPMFLLMIAFASGIGMISDMASGERERRSLEPLLINPISHSTVFLGKWAAAFVVTFSITIIGIAMQFASINAAPTAELGLRLDMGVGKFFIIVLIIMPVIFFAVALQLFVSFFAKSFKDAQSYNGLIIMLPMLPGLYLSFNSGSAEMWQMWVPLLGPTALFVDAVAGDGINLPFAAVATLVSVLCALISGAAGVALLKRERTIFG